MEQEATEVLMSIQLNKDSIQHRDKNCKFIELLKTLDIRDLNPPDYLQHAESPFKWIQGIAKEKLITCNGERKLEDYMNQEECYHFEKFSLYLMLVYDYLILKDYDIAKIYLHDMEEMLQKMSTNPSNKTDTRIGPVFEHLYLATKAHAMILEGTDSSEENAREVGETLKPINDMPKEIQAGIEAVKARFYLSCTKDAKLALQHIKKAVELDPEFVSWQYWTGKILRKLRRDNKEEDPVEELAFFESAVDMERDPKHLVYLAQSYREKSSFLHRTHKNEPNFDESDISREIEDKNNISQQLYSSSKKTEGEETQMAMRPIVHQIKDRSFLTEFNHVICSDKVDLILTSNTDGEVGLHRLNLQTIWIRKPPESVANYVEKMSWNSDSKLIAVAYRYNKNENNYREDVSNGLVLILNLENILLNKVTVKGDISCLAWFDIPDTLKCNADDFFPSIPVLPNTFCCSDENVKNVKILLDLSYESVNFLVVCTNVGDLYITIGGYFSCCKVNVDDLIPKPDGKYFLRNAYLSHDKASVLLLVEVNDLKCTWKKMQLWEIDSTILKSKYQELHILSSKIGHMLTLLTHLMEAIRCVNQIWECVIMSENTSKLFQSNYLNDFESVIADFLELLMFKVMSDPMKVYLFENLNSEHIKELRTCIKDSFAQIKNLITVHLYGSGEQLCLTLHELMGMARSEQYAVLKLDVSLILDALKNVTVLINKTVEVLTVIKDFEKTYSVFLDWLHRVIVHMKNGQTHYDSSEELSESDLNLTTHYLYNLIKVTDTNEHPKSFFQHVGQYFEDKDLSFTPEPNSWQYFLENNPNLLIHPSIIPPCRTMSLLQALNNVHDSLMKMCTCSETVISKTFILKTSIDLPETLNDTFILESCTLSEELGVILAWTTTDVSEDVHLTKIVTHTNRSSNMPTLKDVLLKIKFGILKIVHVKWSLPDTLCILFEEHNKTSKVFLAQICINSQRIMENECIEVNRSTDFVFLWEIPFMSASSLTVSGCRNYGVVLSKSKNRLKVFEIREDEQ